MAEPNDRYDQGSRYLLKSWPRQLLPYLLRLTGEEFDFRGWVDTRRLAWPGQPERTCDTVAFLCDPGAGGIPWAVVIEFQSTPDGLMFGRLLVYLGNLWVECKPVDLTGDRFQVGAVVVNLTGVGTSSRAMHWRKARLKTVLGVGEWNFSLLSAARVLRQVAKGKAPRALLPWVSVMKGGGEPAIIRRWLELAREETDPELRAAMGLVMVFAELTGTDGPWREAMEGWDMKESKVVLEWTEQARREGRYEGEQHGKAEMVLRCLKNRFGTVPEEVARTVRACGDSARLDELFDEAMGTSSVEAFRSHLTKDTAPEAPRRNGKRRKGQT